jgi:ABC-2 type transport system permease protein
MQNSRLEFQRIRGGWLRGFRPIYQKELAYWFGTTRWASQLVIWLGLTVAPVLLATPDNSPERGISYLAAFLQVGSNLMSIGAVLMAQSAIVEEKLTQTLLWIFSKPLSAAGFILAKFAAYGVFVGSIVVGIPAIAIYLAAAVAGFPPGISFFNYLLAVWMIYLLVMFSVALTLLLGAMFNRASIVTSIGIFVFLGGTSLGSNPQLRFLQPYSLWALQGNASMALVGKMPPTAWSAMGCAVLMIGLCLSIAIWRMQQYEH